MVAGLANPEAITGVISEEFYDRVNSDIADRRIKYKKSLYSWQILMESSYNLQKI
jgi:hypothetical protein